MPLRLPAHWIWDFWFAQDGDDVHVFFLHAPRSLGDPELRHRNARIGHAVSRDLRTWRLLPQPIDVGAPGEFDDLATWTGSVLHADGRWHLFYTGISTSDDGKVQRIGSATSDDLVTWRKTGVVLEADPRHYERLHDGVREEAWRDPWVFHDADTGRFHMLVTARATHGPLDGRGVIGHATSHDLRTWHAEPPLSEPGEFYHLEVPQLVHLGDSWRIFFCAMPGDHSSARLARPGVSAEGGTHYLRSDEKLGPYTVAGDRFLVGGPDTRYYAGRLLAHRGRWHFFAWENRGPDGEFVGRLTDPMPVLLPADGTSPLQVLLHDDREPAA